MNCGLLEPDQNLITFPFFPPQPISRRQIQLNNLIQNIQNICGNKDYSLN
jgi:hypothetical protein